ncbi:tyrosine-type recombinase/integrase [Albibacterium bauzanense]|uniref:Integrase/recombinase XerC n=1 Tax=Albibacterium bauzanense TaxID=653929 RepID=A0A4R1M1D9_9SPHI|nr:tyrosine-type recombinase/integrase [Albibacterium bauzanense]TCK85465.1 integrase/recombinase XerC [Albibacterium bauzanense]
MQIVFMFLDRFLSFLKYEKNYSVHSITAYKQNISEYLTFLNEQEFDVQTATHHQVRAYLASLMERKLQARSINRCISSLKTFYKFLLREGILHDNPMLLVKMLKTPKNLPEVIQAESIVQMLEADNIFEDGFEGQRDRIIIELLFGTGIRRAELLHVSENDIDFLQRTIRIFGKGSKERLVPITNTLAKSLNNYIQLKKDRQFENISDKLIVTNTGADAYETLIYRTVTDRLALISSKQKRSPHILRHSIATALLNNGAQLNDIKELLGHASLASTQIYTHNSVERLKSIYKQAHPKA